MPKKPKGKKDKKGTPRDKSPNEIELYFQCSQCLDELPYGVSPAEYANLNVGWSKPGIQVWCNRHDCNIIHIDFEGVKHHLVEENTAYVKTH